MVPAASKGAHGVLGEDAVRPAAVRNDRAVLGQVAQLSGEVGDGNRDGADDVAGEELGFGANGDQDDIPQAQSLGELVVGDAVQLAVSEVGRAS